MPLVDDRQLLQTALQEAARRMGRGWTADRVRQAVRAFNGAVAEVRRRHEREADLLAEAERRTARRARNSKRA